MACVTSREYIKQAVRLTATQYEYSTVLISGNLVPRAFSDSKALRTSLDISPIPPGRFSLLTHEEGVPVVLLEHAADAGNVLDSELEHDQRHGRLAHLVKLLQVPEQNKRRAQVPVLRDQLIGLESTWHQEAGIKPQSLLQSSSLLCKTTRRPPPADFLKCEMVDVINQICEPRNMESQKNDNRSYELLEQPEKKSGLQRESTRRSWVRFPLKPGQNCDDHSSNLLECLDTFLRDLSPRRILDFFLFLFFQLKRSYLRLSFVEQSRG